MSEALVLLRLPIVVAAAFVLFPGARAADEYRPVDTQTSGAPLPPGEALARIRVADGFKVTLAAAEPAVRQPIAMAYDERGRLWVAESYSYNGSDFTEERHDRILIFEDKDGDGVFETRRVFHDHLNRLTGLAVGFGGVWITAPPVVAFIPDRDGDDQPDGEPEIRLDGWTLKAEHNSVNGLTWGPDGWLYGRHGIKDPSRPGIPGTPAASRPEVSCAIWRYHPVRRLFEVIAEGTINPWGLDFDAHGQMFIGTSVVDHLWHVVPGAKFKRWVGREVPLYPHLYELMGPANDHSHASAESLGGGSPTDPDNDFAGGAAHSEAMIYLGDRWPEAFRGSILMSNIHGRRINRDGLQQRGGDGPFVASHERDLLRANDPWFRAVSLLYGPDGDVVLSDWSDNGECHDRDGVHRNSGRLYRLSWGEPRHVAVDLRRASLEELVSLQRHRNEWFVRQARRLLQERAARGESMQNVHAALRTMLEQEQDSALRLRALWSLYVTGGTTSSSLAALVNDSDVHVRHWAIRLLTDEGRVSAASARLMVERAKAESAWLVRMSLASALPALDPESRWQVGAALAQNFSRDEDANLVRLLWIGWHDSVATRPAESLLLAGSSHVPALREWIARRLAEEAKRQPAVLPALIGTLNGDDDPSRAAGLLAGVAAGLEFGQLRLPPEALAPLRGHYDNPLATVQGNALKVGAALGDSEAFQRLRRIVRDESAVTGLRTEALQSLVAAHADGTLDELLALVAAGQLVEPAIRGLTGYTDARIAPAILAAFPRLNKSARMAAVDTLLARESTLRATVDALAAGQIKKTDISHAQARQASKVASPELRQRFENLWGRVNTSSAAVAATMKRLRATMKPDFLQLADRAHGRQLFEQRCAACHTLFGRGGKLAPDLTGSGRKDVEYLIINVVDPNAEIAADWRMAIATLNDGRVVSGVIATESANSVTLQNAEAVTTIERRELRSLERLTTSLMPTGLLDDLPPDHIRDLFGFLMSDGANGAGEGVPRTETSLR